MPSEWARSLHLHLTSFKILQSTAAPKRPLLQKQASRAVQEAIREDESESGVLMCALGTGRMLFVSSTEEAEAEAG